MATLKRFDGTNWNEVDFGHLKPSDATTTPTANKLVKRDASGNIEGNYIKGTWLYTSNATDNANWTDVYVNSAGWLYKRSKANFKSDLGIPTSIDGLSGGTLTSALILSGGDAASGVANIQLDTDGQITAKNTTSTLFGRTNSSTLVVGHSSHTLTLRGSATRPKYNGNNLALYSDIPSFKTINNQTITGSGNINISGGGTPTPTTIWTGDQSLTIGTTAGSVSSFSITSGVTTSGWASGKRLRFWFTLSSYRQQAIVIDAIIQLSSNAVLKGFQGGNITSLVDNRTSAIITVAGDYNDNMFSTQIFVAAYTLSVPNSSWPSNMSVLHLTKIELYDY